MLNDKILYLVDDDEGIRYATGFLLRICGYTVVTFASGDEFLGAANHLPPGCLLLEIRMPGSDGLEVQLELNTRGANYPVIIMTGDGSPALSVRAFNAGAVNFIEKPFAKAELLAAVREAFQRLLKERDNDCGLIDRQPIEATRTSKVAIFRRSQMQPNTKTH